MYSNTYVCQHGFISGCPHGCVYQPPAPPPATNFTFTPQPALDRIATALEQLAAQLGSVITGIQHMMEKAVARAEQETTDDPTDEYDEQPEHHVCTGPSCAICFP